MTLCEICHERPATVTDDEGGKTVMCVPCYLEAAGDG